MDERLIGKLAANSLKLSQFSGFDLITLELRSDDKDKVLYELAELLSRSENISDQESAYHALIERENLASTGMGFGVAVPHGRCPDCTGLTIAFARSEKGINFSAFDGEPVYLFFAILVPITSIHLHLQVLASLSLMLQNPENRKRLMDVEFPQEVLDFLNGQ